MLLVFLIGVFFPKLEGRAPEAYPVSGSVPKQQKKPLSTPLSLIAGEEYIITIKGFSHSQKIFCKQNQSGELICSKMEGLKIDPNKTITIDLSSLSLKFGDVDSDNQVDTKDYSLVKTCRINNAKKGDDYYEEGCNWADGNFDGEVNSTDIDLLYKALIGNPEDK